MAVRMTRKRLDIIMIALNYLESEYEATEDTPYGFRTRHEFDRDLEACYGWIRQTVAKRNKHKADRP